MKEKTKHQHKWSLLAYEYGKSVWNCSECKRIKLVIITKDKKEYKYFDIGQTVPYKTNVRENNKCHHMTVQPPTL